MRDKHGPGVTPTAMAKIIRLDDARPAARMPASGCAHKRVKVYRADRTVRCEICNALLDPFDVLVDLVQRMDSPLDD